MLIETIRTDDCGNCFILREPLKICVEIANDATLLVIVPEGFRSDGASVPRFLWRFVFPNSEPKALRGAFLHDYIYRTAWLHKAVSRADADRAFRRLIIADGVEEWRAWIAYAGVRVFGGLSWRGDE